MRVQFLDVLRKRVRRDNIQRVRDIAKGKSRAQQVAADGAGYEVENTLPSHPLMAILLAFC